jgi:hypothetical protein
MAVTTLMRLHRRSTAHALMRSAPIGRPEFYIRLVKVGLANTDSKFCITSICYVRDVRQAPSTQLLSTAHPTPSTAAPYLLYTPLTRPEATPTAQRPLNKAALPLQRPLYSQLASQYTPRPHHTPAIASCRYPAAPLTTATSRTQQHPETALFRATKLLRKELCC